MKSAAAKSASAALDRTAPRQPAQLRVPGWLHFASGLHERYPRFWIGLGNRETQLLQERLPGEAPSDPIYVTGLARSGSTILLELLARTPDLAVHRYKDFPFLFTPWSWNWFLERAAREEGPPQERAHGDSIAVTSESPEAFEEMMWMAFFPNAHNPRVSNVLDGSVTNPAFERFYRNHIRKLLLVRGGRRYLAKANYNVTRLEYLLKLFPKARFLVPVRDPVAHVASLMRQHARFRREHERDGRLLAHMRRSGHFEFGLDRRPVNTGEPGAVDAVQQLWAEGHEAEGCAEYWSSVYGHLAGRLEVNPALRDATLLVSHEDLCTAPRLEMRQILAHCRLDASEIVSDAEKVLRRPGDGHSGLRESERDAIRVRTCNVARRLASFTSARNA